MLLKFCILVSLSLSLIIIISHTVHGHNTRLADEEETEESNPTSHDREASWCSGVQDVCCVCDEN